jgi:hypothetical protein
MLIGLKKYPIIELLLFFLSFIKNNPICQHILPSPTYAARIPLVKRIGWTTMGSYGRISGVKNIRKKNRTFPDINSSPNSVNLPVSTGMFFRSHRFSTRDLDLKKLPKTIPNPRLSFLNAPLRLIALINFFIPFILQF